MNEPPFFSAPAPADWCRRATSMVDWRKQDRPRSHLLLIFCCWIAALHLDRMRVASYFSGPANSSTIQAQYTRAFLLRSSKHLCVLSCRQRSSRPFNTKNEVSEANIAAPYQAQCSIHVDDHHRSSANMCLYSEKCTDRQVCIFSLGIILFNVSCLSLTV